MPDYKTRTITGSPTCYKYSDGNVLSARSPRHAALKHAKRVWADAQTEYELAGAVMGEPDTLTVVVGGHRYEYDTFVVCPDPKPVAVRAVRSSAASALAKLTSVLKEIQEMPREDAESLVLALESLHLDTCYISEFNAEHPATTNYRCTGLSMVDALDGVRLMLHGTWDGIDYLDADNGLLERGGFSPYEPRDA